MKNNLRNLAIATVVGTSLAGCSSVPQKGTAYTVNEAADKSSEILEDGILSQKSPYILTEDFYFTYERRNKILEERKSSQEGPIEKISGVRFVVSDTCEILISHGGKSFIKTDNISSSIACGDKIKEDVKEKRVNGTPVTCGELYEEAPDNFKDYMSIDNYCKHYNLAVNNNLGIN